MSFHVANQIMHANLQSMHSHQGCCRWCRSPPTAVCHGSPTQRSTDTPACTARFWRPPPAWRPWVCCRRSLAVLWSPSHSTCRGSCSRSRWIPGWKTKDTIHIHYLRLVRECLRQRQIIITFSLSSTWTSSWVYEHKKYALKGTLGMSYNRSMLYQSKQIFLLLLFYRPFTFPVS